MSHINFNLFTFNLGDTQKHSQEEWYSEFTSRIHSENKWETMMTTPPEGSPHPCWVVCTQEDIRDSAFMPAFLNALNTHNSSARYVQLQMSVEHDNTIKSVRMTMNPKFNVHLSIFVPNHLAMHNVVPTIIRHNEKKMSLILRWGDCMFAGCHLPFKPLPQNKLTVNLGMGFGFKARKEALDSVVDVFSGDSDVQNLLLMGDLNFRVLPGRGDQLKTVLQVNTNRYSGVKDLTWPYAKHVFVPTCKMKQSTTTKLRVDCHERKEYDDSHHVENENTCYNSKRYPSLCDRVLYSAKSGQQEVKYNASVFEYGKVKFSDHNAILIKGITIPLYFEM